MACYRPIPAAQEGSEPPKLWPPMGHANLALPCGKCIGCRSARATQWAHRCTHEASQWEHNTFITLTYEDAHLPPEGHLDAEALQRFFKRLRKYRERPGAKLASNPHSNLRYFACGEYGETSGRPHYHAIIFNGRFTDEHRVGDNLYESDTLATLWPFGANRVGTVTGQSANYIAQYSLKKQGAGDHDADGVWRPAPFLRMSLKPAIGLAWLAKYAPDLRHGYLVENGYKHGIPRTYKEKLKQMGEEMTTRAIQHLAEEIDIRTRTHQRNNPSNRNDPERQKAAEQIQIRYKQLTENRRL